MTLLDATSRAGAPAPPAQVRGGRDLVVPLAALAVVLLRLAYLTAPMSADEGGFLAVGAQWHAHGTSLYGDYWVDRPPLLIGLFGLASRLGGLSGLRLIGCVAAAVTVVACASAAGRIAGPRARGVSAVVAAAMLSTPVVGAVAVNGELLAAPFVVGALVATLSAVDAERDRPALRAAVAAGALSAAAVLVKQNMVDGAVVAAVCWSVSLLRHRIPRRRGRGLVLGFAVGAVGVLAVTALGAWLLGSSPLGVYDAMYPFRLHAARVLAAGNSAPAAARLHRLLVAWLIAGMPLAMLGLGWHVVRGRARRASHVALVVMLVVASASVLAGGSWWTHYLIELVGPTAVAVGLLVGDRAVGARVLAGLMTVVALAGWTSGLASTASVSGPTVGRSIAAAARVGDTVVSAFGDGDIVASSGLHSPYPYLWSLPTHTLDGRLSVMRRVLSGPHAPTWLVIRGARTRAFLNRHTGTLVARRYHPDGRVCGREVYLLDGTARGTVRPVASCHESLAGSWAPQWVHLRY